MSINISRGLSLDYEKSKIDLSGHRPLRSKFYHSYPFLVTPYGNILFEAIRSSFPPLIFWLKEVILKMWQGFF
jgi:hypothetical protein